MDIDGIEWGLPRAEIYAWSGLIALAWGAVALVLLALPD
jgi:hypothetical protein